MLKETFRRNLVLRLYMLFLPLKYLALLVTVEKVRLHHDCGLEDIFLLVHMRYFFLLRSFLLINRFLVFLFLKHLYKYLMEEFDIVAYFFEYLQFCLKVIFSSWACSNIILIGILSIF